MSRQRHPYQYQGKANLTLLILLSFSLMLIIAGCGGMSSNTPGPVAFTPPGNNGGGSGSTGGNGGGSGGGTTSGGGDAFAACGTVSNNQGEITGKIIDATTGKPISGRVIVNFDQEQGGWINTVEASTTDGSFQSHDHIIGASNFTVSFLAIDANGVIYGPKILIPTTSCQIKQGTGLGTISLSPGPSATIQAQVTAQTAQGTPARIAEHPEGIFVPVNGIMWAIPWSGQFFVPSSQNLEPDASCPANTACTQINLPVSGASALWAFYDGGATKFQTATATPEYALTIDPQGRSDTLTMGQCQQQAEFQPPTAVPAGSTTTFGPFKFVDCR